MRHFEVYLMGTLHSASLYDSGGCEVFDVMTAAHSAERQHGVEWREVCDGMVGMTRDEYLDLPGT